MIVVNENVFSELWVSCICRCVYVFVCVWCYEWVFVMVLSGLFLLGVFYGVFNKRFFFGDSYGSFVGVSLFSFLNRRRSDYIS